MACISTFARNVAYGVTIGALVGSSIYGLLELNKQEYPRCVSILSGYPSYLRSDLDAHLECAKKLLANIGGYMLAGAMKGVATMAPISVLASTLIQTAQAVYHKIRG